MALMKAHTITRHHTATMFFLRFSLFLAYLVKVNSSDLQDQPSSIPPKEVVLDQDSLYKLLKNVFPTASISSEYAIANEEDHKTGQVDLFKQAPTMYSHQHFQNMYENPFQQMLPNLHAKQKIDQSAYKQMPRIHSSQQTINNAPPNVFRHPVQEVSNNVPPNVFRQPVQEVFDNVPPNVFRQPVQEVSDNAPPNVFRQPVQEVSDSIYEHYSEDIPQKPSIKKFPTNAQQILLQNKIPKKTPASIYHNIPVQDVSQLPDLPTTELTHNMQPNFEQIQQHIQKTLQNVQNKPETELFQNPFQYIPKQENYEEMYRELEAKGVEDVIDNVSNIKQIPQNFYQRSSIQRSKQENTPRSEFNYFPPPGISHGFTNPLIPLFPRASEIPEDQTQKLSRHIQTGAIKVIQVTPDTPSPQILDM